ncbi:hypothetical protein GCK32_017397 [Trichostrongylus colubriformis]|uniref:Uncharacterized protein n=1 Tax=Trichostrongylus colubriformis TaxID=6319 RepID=A0AAN8J2P1_TRICO
MSNTSESTEVSSISEDDSLLKLVSLTSPEGVSTTEGLTSTIATAVDAALQSNKKGVKVQSKDPYNHDVMPTIIVISAVIFLLISVVLIVVIMLIQQKQHKKKLALASQMEKEEEERREEKRRKRLARKKKEEQIRKEKEEQRRKQREKDAEMNRKLEDYLITQSDTNVKGTQAGKSPSPGDDVLRRMSAMNLAENVMEKNAQEDGN